jgi:hypothetical protein
MECYVDFRSEASSNTRFDTGAKINFCPWCGVSIANHYSGDPDAGKQPDKVIVLPTAGTRIQRDQQ